MKGPRPPLTAAGAAELLVREGARAAILVEGWSDQAALEALARRRAIDLRAQSTAVVPVGGVTNFGKFVDVLGPRGLDLRLGGLCDAGEAPWLVRNLGFAQQSLEAHGFFTCDADLEDELVRALGTDATENVLASEGELASFRRFQDQPAQRGRPVPAQLRRFMGTRARRKIRLGALLVEALRLDCVPRPLDAVLAHIRG